MGGWVQGVTTFGRVVGQLTKDRRVTLARRLEGLLQPCSKDGQVVRLFHPPLLFCQELPLGVRDHGGFNSGSCVTLGTLSVTCDLLFS